MTDVTNYRGKWTAGPAGTARAEARLAKFQAIHSAHTLKRLVKMRDPATPPNKEVAFCEFNGMPVVLSQRDAWIYADGEWIVVNKSDLVGLSK